MQLPALDNTRAVSTDAACSPTRVSPSWSRSLGRGPTWVRGVPRNLRYFLLALTAATLFVNCFFWYEHDPQLANDNVGRLPTRAFVCITGQVERLELATKFGHIFVPLRNHFAAVDVALVLSTGTAAFTNTEGAAERRPLYATVQEVDAALQRYKMPGVTVERFEYTKPDRPIATHAFQMNKHCSGANNTWKAEWCKQRARNHARQYFAMSACQDAMFAFSQRSDESYELAGRVRDDAVLPIPINVARIAAKVSASPVFVGPKCDCWSGVNDKMGFVAAQHASAFFGGPLRVYYGSSIDWQALRVNGGSNNPETFLLHAYNSSGLQPDFDDSLKPLKLRDTVDYGNGRFRYTWRKQMRYSSCHRKSGFLVKPLVPASSGCVDVEGYEDSTGYTCADYAQKAWCTPSLGEGDGWPQHYGTLWGSSQNTDNISAPMACCACGGGILTDFFGRPM